MDARPRRSWSTDPERSVGSVLRRLGRELGACPDAVRAVRSRLEAAGIDPHEEAGPYLFAIRAALRRETERRADLHRVRHYLDSVRRRLERQETGSPSERRILEKLRLGLEERLRALDGPPPAPSSGPARRPAI